jgi:hypothetical protein
MLDLKFLLLSSDYQVLVEKILRAFFKNSLQIFLVALSKLIVLSFWDSPSMLDLGRIIF